MTVIQSAIALFFLLFPLAAQSADSQGRFWQVEVVSEASCGTFVTARDEARRGRHGHENIYLDWLAGYLTAYNTLQPDTYDIQGAADMPSLMLWLENHCKARPLDSFGTAVSELTTELYPKRVKQAPK
jgi:hypothetical protein